MLYFWYALCKDAAIYKSKRKFLYTKREKSSGPTCDVDDKYYNIIVCKRHLSCPFYGLAVFVLFNLWEKGKIAEKIWLFLGKHSTNIWLTHMFFYLYIFIGAIQRLQYPVLMFGGMIEVCVAVSVVILKLHEIICDRKGKNRSFAWN